MPQKIRDIAVKTGEYQDGQGQTKGRWQNVGALMKSDEGGEFIILHRWFNPAGVPNPENRDSVVLSCFQLKDRNDSGQSQQSGQQAPQQPAQQAPNQGGGFDNYDDDIPF